MEHQKWLLNQAALVAAIGNSMRSRSKGKIFHVICIIHQSTCMHKQNHYFKRSADEINTHAHARTHTPIYTERLSILTLTLTSRISYLQMFFRSRACEHKAINIFLSVDSLAFYFSSFLFAICAYMRRKKMRRLNWYKSLETKLMWVLRWNNNFWTSAHKSTPKTQPSLLHCLIHDTLSYSFFRTFFKIKCWWAQYCWRGKQASNNSNNRNMTKWIQCVREAHSIHLLPRSFTYWLIYHLVLFQWEKITKFFFFFPFHFIPFPYICTIFQRWRLQVRKNLKTFAARKNNER